MEKTADFYLAGQLEGAKTALYVAIVTLCQRKPEAIQVFIDSLDEIMGDRFIGKISETQLEGNPPEAQAVYKGMSRFLSSFRNELAETRDDLRASE